MSEIGNSARVLFHANARLKPVEHEALMAELGQAWANAGLPSITLVSSREWKAKTMARCGSLQGWVWDTIQGREYSSRRPKFAGMMVPGPWLDFTGAQLVSTALQAAKPVFVWLGSSFGAAIRIDPARDDDGQLCWAAESVPLEETA